MTAHPNVAAMEADLVSFTTALEELETEIVFERAKALEAQDEAHKADEAASDLREQLREAMAEIEELKKEAERLQSEADDMEKDRDAAQEREGENMVAAQDALQDFLFENGYGSGNGYIRDPYVRRLVDAILP